VQGLGFNPQHKKETKQAKSAKALQNETVGKFNYIKMNTSGH
jgi:hypothetical protein